MNSGQSPIWLDHLFRRVAEMRRLSRSVVAKFAREPGNLVERAAESRSSGAHPLTKMQGIRWTRHLVAHLLRFGRSKRLLGCRDTRASESFLADALEPVLGFHRASAAIRDAYLRTIPLERVELIRRVAMLVTPNPAVVLRSHAVTARLLDETSPLNNGSYKRREDLLDAALCAWTASL